MKFYEVMSQIVLTSHLVGFDLLTVSKKVWDEMGAEKQAKFQAAADAAIDFSHREAPDAREGAGRDLQGQGPEDLRARRRRLPQARPGEVSRLRPRQGLAGRHGREDQRAVSADQVADAGRHCRSAPASPSCDVASDASRTDDHELRTADDSARWLYRRAENVLAAMLAVMFVAFILQIVFRYLLNLPIGWTNELSVDPLDLAGAVRRGLRRARGGGDPLRPDLRPSARPDARVRCSSISAAALIVLYGISFPAVVDYVTFMKVENTAYLEDPLRLAVLDLRRLRRRHRSSATCGCPGRRCAAQAPEEFDPTKAGSGV